MGDNLLKKIKIDFNKKSIAIEIKKINRYMLWYTIN